ncbi:2-succinyl-5-enolpyruvyl-6-hydroxy-3-cyclohexene-1-carboxylic-acid synthase [Litchfieldia alkalitelluris]|uniref:2-succinyl-5-enolpyruvyl-6-hydroxy-3- cyclohexene-1-carboxylic-acid synthase n=1 Tax=Litchfieldia alkalitelluris TaxID=304268 RepID=UPI00099638C6|nr:2-succinyl-5-enolpyruvyl-6-hydroxy-3-cyclohexene-1-carboxylic-acid synthase [Litchfieldia alkalitelluris]
MSNTDSLTSYVAAFVDELVRVGVKDVVISPGSRSTPIAILMAEHSEMTTYLNIDERSASYFALGIAKARKVPVALLCTSGTAAANYFPAVVEANLSRVPLIVITADRPHELRDVGAPQAIDQNQLYGKHTKWFVEMAIPERSDEMIRYVRTVASRAAGKAISAPAGPVHLNIPLREPLVPNLSQEKLFTKGRKPLSQEVNMVIGKAQLSDFQAQGIASQINGKEKGLIICGDFDDKEFAQQVTLLAEKLNYPILADPLSQLRSGKHSKDLILDSYDTFLRNQDFIESYTPEVIIRFGAMPISKALLLYLKKKRDVLHLVVDGDGGWREPTMTASEMVYCGEAEFCDKLVHFISEAKQSIWTNDWKRINEVTREQLKHIEEDNGIFEGKVFQQLQDLLPSESILFVGNSMPIRDLDTFFVNQTKPITILANRGANGIDGIVSTSLGISTTGRKTVLVIGDLSFYHDLNGLLAAKQNNLDLTIVLINNDGGGIFSFLPQSKEEKHFEYLFGTPTGLNFEHTVKMYGGQFSSIKTWPEFKGIFEHSLKSKGLNVIELRTDRGTNLRDHRNLWNRVSQEITLEIHGDK